MWLEDVITARVNITELRNRHVLKRVIMLGLQTEDVECDEIASRK